MTSPHWILKEWQDLSTDELYAVLKLRQEVFVVEQDCPYLDCDDIDQKALHLWAEADGDTVAYARIIPPGELYPEVSIGRVISAQKHRRSGWGRSIMDKAVSVCETQYPGPIRIMAQSYLLAFYRSYGFVEEGDEFLEDGLPHYYMVRP